MIVPHDQLAPETLRNLIEYFVGREGTDYGDREVTLEAKVAQVLRRLERGEAFVLFDPDTESCNIATPRELAEFTRRPPPRAPSNDRSEARVAFDRRDAQVERDYDDACQDHPSD